MTEAAEKAKRYLNQIRLTDDIVRMKATEILHLREYGQIKQSLKEICISNSGEISDPTFSIVEQIDDLYAEIDDLIERQKKAIEKIENSRMEKPLKDVLICRYAYCLTWDKIAETMTYDRRYCLKLHAKALHEFGTYEM